jgi:hypothetical protein
LATAAADQNWQSVNKKQIRTQQGRIFGLIFLLEFSLKPQSGIDNHDALIGTLA